MDIWTEKLVRRHLPILERWLDRSAGEITPNDLPSDAHELESWFDMCAAEPERLDCLTLIYETPVGVAGLRLRHGQKDTLELYLLLGEVGYNLHRTAAYATLRMLDRAFLDADVKQVTVRVSFSHAWFLDVLAKMGFYVVGTEDGMTALTVNKNGFLSSKYLF